MNQLYQQNIYHVNLYLNFIVKNVIQIKTGITIKLKDKKKLRNVTN